MVFEGFFAQSNMVKSVADLCCELNITIADLAQRSGLEDGRVMAIALGRWTPSPAERQKIAAVFGIGVDEIAWGHKTPIQHLYGHGPG
jgi:transcriptional regulator with XRE-family HTH domain